MRANMTRKIAPERALALGALTLGLASCNQSVEPVPSALAFATQPAGASSGTAFATQPTVRITDATGNLVATSTASVTVTLETNPAGATLSGTLTVSAVDGVATFTDLSLDKVSSGYTLTASADGLTSATSAPFDVGPGAPGQLTFATQPAGGPGGTPFTTQPVVEVRDAGGNLLAGRSVTVTVALGANPGAGQLSGTTTLSTSTGLASFTNLQINKAAAGYTLVASVAGAPSVTSGSFDVTVGPPAALRFTIEPGSAASGTPFGSQPVVELLDAGGNRVTASSRDVTVGVGTNAVGGHLSGTLTASTAAGLASFTDLAIDRAGSGYTLIVSSVGLAPDTSAAFPVTLRFQSVSVSMYMGCGLAVGGAGYCWGRNQLGGLGIGSSGTNHSQPMLLAGGLTFSVVDVGSGTNENGFWDGFGCGITAGGDTYCWGRNNFGQLGNGTTGTDSNVPVLVSGGQAFTQISAGRDHVCALTESGEAYCWGRNAIGGLGDSTTNNSNVPVHVHGGHTWTDISVGVGDTCGVDNAGDVYCWGSPPSDLPGFWVTVPTLLAGGIKFKRVSTGWLVHRCGVSVNDDGYCWGQNNGDLGNGSDTTGSATPVLVSGGFKFKTVQAGGPFSCGLTLDGDVYCWGFDENGALGQGTSLSSNTPLKVVGGLTYSQLSVGAYQTCGVTTSGAGYCWGDGWNGERADGTFVLQVNSPVRIKEP